MHSLTFFVSKQSGAEEGLQMSEDMADCILMHVMRHVLLASDTDAQNKDAACVEEIRNQICALVRLVVPGSGLSDLCGSSLTSLCLSIPATIDASASCLRASAQTFLQPLFPAQVKRILKSEGLILWPPNLFHVHFHCADCIP